MQEENYALKALRRKLTGVKGGHSPKAARHLQKPSKNASLQQKIEKLTTAIQTYDRRYTQEKQTLSKKLAQCLRKKESLGKEIENAKRRENESLQRKKMMIVQIKALRVKIEKNQAE